MGKGKWVIDRGLPRFPILKLLYKVIIVWPKSLGWSKFPRINGTYKSCTTPGKYSEMGSLAKTTDNPVLYSTTDNKSLNPYAAELTFVQCTKKQNIMKII